jgi:ankyrin repeat protein
MADAGCVLQADSKYDCLFLALALPQPGPSPCSSVQFFQILLILISGWTALMWSSLNGNFDITRFLVESGANLDAKHNAYYTPTT